MADQQTRPGPARWLIAHASPLRAAVKSKLGQHVVQSARALRHLSPPARFIRGQLSNVPVGRYTLRSTGQTVVLRHRSADLISLNEVHHNSIYVPPEPAQTALDRAPVRQVVDLGGNIGMFTLHALHTYREADVVVYEPDAGNASMLAQSVQANGAGARVDVRQAIAGTEAGEQAFITGNFVWSRVAEPGEDGAVLVQTDDVLPLLEGVDLLKVDIEGSEWDLLADPRFPASGVRVIALEWHEQRCPAPDGRLHAEKLLQEAGYDVRHDPPDLPICGTLWAWLPTPAGA